MLQGRPSRWAAATARCPKQMSHGPCAGVTADGGCEVPDFGSCTFMDVATDAWPYSMADAPAAPPGALSTAAARFLATAAVRPVVVIDLPAEPLSAKALLASAAELAGSADALLLGEHGGARLQFPPSYRARLLAENGHSVWAGVNCRDRNRVAIEGELAACVDAGVVAVHCVTGDHTSLGDRPEAQPVFDLDCIDVVELARAAGALSSVAHAPSAPPIEQRLARLLAKVAAGAQVVFVDHCGGPAQVEAAVAALRGAGFDGLVLACVPVVTSLDSATVIESFARDRLPPSYVSDILSADDAAVAGVAAAVSLSLRLLEIPGLNGVNLSGGGGPGQEVIAARRLAGISRLVISATSGTPYAGPTEPALQETSP